MQVKQISDNEIHLLIKYIKSILWRVVKCLSYIEEARCLKVKQSTELCQQKCEILSILFCVKVGSLWCVRTGCPAHPASYPMRYLALRLLCSTARAMKLDHSPYSTEVENAHSHTSVPPIFSQRDA